MISLARGMRRQGFVYCGGAPEQILYDRVDKQTYAPFPLALSLLNNTLTRTIKDISQDFLVWLLWTQANQNP
jgi:hypothetical protein